VRWSAGQYLQIPEIRWIVRENLKKSRLRRMDADWVNELDNSGVLGYSRGQN